MFSLSSVSIRGGGGTNSVFLSFLKICTVFVFPGKTMVAEGK